MKVKIRGRDFEARANMKCNGDTYRLYADEMVQLFFKMYKKLGYCNKLTVVVHGMDGENKAYTCDPE